MRMSILRTATTVTATLLLMFGALAALAAEDITTGPLTDGSTDATSVAPGDYGGEVVSGEIRTSSISSERLIPEVSVVQYFVYSGPGSVDLPTDEPSSCLVSFVGGQTMRFCAQ